MAKIKKTKKKKSKKNSNGNVEIWTEEQYETYMEELYGMEYIAGYTENGVPFGTFIRHFAVSSG